MPQAGVLFILLFLLVSQISFIQGTVSIIVIGNPQRNVPHTVIWTIDDDGSDDVPDQFFLRKSLVIFPNVSRPEDNTLVKTEGHTNGTVTITFEFAGQHVLSALDKNLKTLNSSSPFKVFDAQVSLLTTSLSTSTTRASATTTSVISTSSTSTDVGATASGTLITSVSSTSADADNGLQTSSSVSPHSTLALLSPSSVPPSATSSAVPTSSISMLPVSGKTNSNPAKSPVAIIIAALISSLVGLFILIFLIYVLLRKRRAGQIPRFVPEKMVAAPNDSYSSSQRLPYPFGLSMNPFNWREQRLGRRTLNNQDVENNHTSNISKTRNIFREIRAFLEVTSNLDGDSNSRGTSRASFTTFNEEEKDPELFRYRYSTSTFDNIPTLHFSVLTDRQMELQERIREWQSRLITTMHDPAAMEEVRAKIEHLKGLQKSDWAKDKSDEIPLSLLSSDL